MKKFLYLVVFVIASGVLVQAQTMDTIFWNQRRADLYYWGSNWIDSSVMAHPNEPLYWIDDVSRPDCFIGRTCVTPAPLRVIGIGAPVSIEKKIESCLYAVDTSMANRLPEYFQLYQQENDSIHFVTEIRWDTVTPLHKIQIHCGYHSNPYYSYNLTKVYDFYEAYFEKPIIVHDTFYVGGTHRNNLLWGDDGENIDLFGCPVHPVTLYHPISINHTNALHTNPPYHIIRYYSTTLFANNNNYTGPFFDTTHFIKKYQSGIWYPFFAIFDTNFFPGVGSFDDSCMAPAGFHIENLGLTDVSLAWNAGGETMWELSIAPMGENLSNGLMEQMPINYAYIDSLETGLWYTARVRTLCDTDVFGPWSAPLTFYLGNAEDTVTCPSPAGLKVESTSVGKVVLSWTNNTEATSWQVEAGSVETPVGEGVVTTAPVPFTARSGLDTATWHWARVRSKCGTDWYSLWTDTVMFYIPSDTTDGPDNPDNPNDTTQAINLVEQYTYLMPNPARDEVTVASSFRVKAVELYAADGKLLQQVEVNAVGTTLSLEGLPAGIYFVRVRTSAGVTTKRLVVE